MSALGRCLSGSSKPKLLAAGQELLRGAASVAPYSKSSSDSFYKVVKSKIRLDDETDANSSEGGLNWELFAPRGNRFFLPGSMGPAWQGATTTAVIETDLEKLVDFEEEDPKKMQITSTQCPVLLRERLHELFPAPEVYNKGVLSMVTLSYRRDSEVESGAKNFVLAAREMCSRLRENGYWADFMNPFSGKPFYSYASGKNLYKIDERFRGLGIKFESQQDCLIISVDAETAFTGSVFTNAPASLTMLQALVVD